MNLTIFVAELIGTLVLVVLGNGVVANVILNRTKGQNAGWMVVSMGWAMAVFVAVLTTSAQGAHVNPAVTLGLAATGRVPAMLVPVHLSAQLAGAVLGAAVVWLFYKKHFDATQDAEGIRACFSTSPAIRSWKHSFLAECVATAIFMYAIASISGGDGRIIGSLQALPVALLVLGLALSLGGSTGCAINPARDLGPRIAHAFLPIPHKGSSDWQYAWIPVVAPVVGAVLGAWVHRCLN